MTICKVCGEEHDNAREKCPYCGCPVTWIQESNLLYPQKWKERYRLIQVSGRSEPFPDGIYWDSEHQERVRIQKLPAGHEGKMCVKFISSLNNNEEWHPKLLDLKAPTETEPGYYVCSVLDGMTIQELLEKENPPNPELAGQIERGLMQLLNEMERCGIAGGIFAPAHICMIGGKIALVDLGPGNFNREDRQQVQELTFRVRNGWWPWEDPANEKTSVKKIFHKIFGRK